MAAIFAAIISTASPGEVFDESMTSHSLAHGSYSRNVVLPGDHALRKAVQAAYQLDHLPSQQEVLAIAEKWRPYRSLATSYLFSAAFERTEAPPVLPPET